jgi:peroxiredoxin
VTAALALVGWLGPAACAEEARPPALVGTRLPAADLEDPSGRRVRLAEVREPVLVLNLFAFWCDTWIAQLPQLRELAAEQEALGFRLLSVSVDGKWAEQLRVICGAEPPPFAVLIDRGSRLTRQLRVRRIPTVIVADRERRITYVGEAYAGNAEVLAAIRRAASDGTAEGNQSGKL